MKILVVYYSRTGTTKKLAQELAESFNCEAEEIIDIKNRKGPVGFFVSGKDALSQKLTEIKTIKHNPQDFNLIIAGCPVWAGNIPPALRTYLEENKNQIKNIACFATMGSSGDDKMYKKIKKIINKNPIATLTLTTKQVKDSQKKEEKKQFVQAIKNLSLS